MANPDGNKETASSVLLSQVSQPALDDRVLDEIKELSLELTELPDVELSLSSPAYSLLAPSGFGSSLGTVSFGAGGVESRGESNEGQGGIVAGFGLGDPNEYVGLDLSFVLSDLDEGVGGLNGKLHRNLIITNSLALSVAAGWDDFVPLGSRSGDSSVYGVTSVIIKLSPDIRESFSRLALSVGVGGGQFRTEEDILRGEDTVGVFGGAALRVTQSFSILTEWTGQDLAAGLSWAPFEEYNLFITPFVRDLAGAGDEARFGISAGASFTY